MPTYRGFKSRPCNQNFMLNKPSGLIYLLREHPNNTDGYTNPCVHGVRLRSPGWSTCEPSKGSYDWSVVDQAIENARANGKQIGVSFPTLCDAPAWLQATRWRLPETDGGNAFEIVLPWDSSVQGHLLSFIEAHCKHLDGRVDYIVMTGLGCRIESFITPDPANIGLDMATAVALWKESCSEIIEAYAYTLKQTPFLFTAAKPYQSQSAGFALIDVV